MTELAGELCRIFLGWKLGGDHDALLALGEGALAIDVLSGECSCDGEPIPPLFIAGELGDVLTRALERAGATRESLREAQLEALFEKQVSQRRGREVPTLRLACRARLVTGSASAEAEANNATPG